MKQKTKTTWIINETKNWLFKDINKLTNPWQD